MDTDEGKPKWRLRLRERAEDLIKESARGPKKLTPRDILELIHELEVHQIELELQNEELRLSQLEVETARKKYFDLYDLAPVGYVMLDSNGVIHEINLTGANLLGTERRHCRGQAFIRFIASPDRPEFHKFCRRLIETKGREECELRLVSRDKAPVEVLLSGVAILESESARKLFQVAMTDITATKAAEMWRRRLFEATNDAAISIDHRGQIALFNPAAEKMFGYTADEAIGKNVNILMPEPYASEHESYLARYERSGEGRVIGKTRELVARRKSGEIFPIELSVTEIGQGRELSYVAFLRDISEKAQLQAQITERARLETIDVTTAMMVHEIANPLYGISVTLEVLQRQMHKTTKKTVGATLERIGDEISRLKALIKDYRSLASRDEYRFLPRSLTNIIEEFCLMETPKLVVRGISLETVLEAGLPEVYADGEKIKQVLLNLCQNAQDAMPEGGTLTLKCYESEGRVILDVCDSGEGIPKDFELFVPFKTTKSFGTGLGLIITQRIVARHEGSLSYTSEPRKGTTFTVSFPAYTAS